MADNRAVSVRGFRTLTVVTAIPLWVACAIFLASGLIGSAADPTVTWMETWGTAIAFWCGAGAVGWRALHGGERVAPWGWATVACLLWAYANTYYAIVIAPAVAPIPSPLDIGYSLFPVALGVALVLLAHRRGVNYARAVLLDAAVASLGTAALLTAIMFSATSATGESLASLITTLLYPTEDIVLLSMVVGFAAVLGWRIDRAFTVFGLGIVAITAADVLSFTDVFSGATTGGAWTNLGWTLGIALLTLAAVLSYGVGKPLADHAPSAEGRIVIPIGFSAVAIGVLALSSPLNLPVAVLPLSAAALTAALARLYLLFHEALGLAESRLMARTDDLTGLANRRQLMSDLEEACARGDAVVLALFDLDGFKLFNDTFGHGQGDDLLRELARSAVAAAPTDAVVYRLGGDEFCVIAPDAGFSDIAGVDARVSVEGIRGAFESHGPGWTVTASAGVVALPAEASTSSDALRLADRRMYAQKARRPDAARRQAGNVLLSALGLQQPWLEHHTNNATLLVVALARRLGLTEDEIDDVTRAAELHDVGKLAIPAEILNKPGPLDPVEWEIMKRHTVIGEEMLRAAPALVPIAGMVRASHERWDGGGYPDHLAGDAIPIGARIVAICDAFDAMVSDRPYRDGISPAGATAEIARCAGTQFDPRVVEAFLALQQEIGDQHAAGRPLGRSVTPSIETP